MYTPKKERKNTNMQPLVWRAGVLVVPHVEPSPPTSIFVAFLWFYLYRFDPLFLLYFTTFIVSHDSAPDVNSPTLLLKRSCRKHHSQFQTSQSC